jgi:hypothetical protein
MERARGWAIRSVILALIIAAHVLVFSLVSASRRSGRLLQAPEIEVLLLVPQQHAEATEAKKRRAMSHNVSAARRVGSRESSAITSTDESLHAPKTDWQLEAETTVTAMMPKLEREQRHRCEEAEWAREARPFGCPKRYYDKAWQPSGDFLTDMRDPERPRGGTPTRYRTRS